MAKVKAKVLCFIDNGLRQPGDEFEYEGPFNGNLEYIGGSPKAKESAETQEVQVVARRPGRPRKAAVGEGIG
jgi:hypothetical protein